VFTFLAPFFSLPFDLPQNQVSWRRRRRRWLRTAPLAWCSASFEIVEIAVLAFRLLASRAATGADNERRD
jgi:hypothetical protein